jgi:putative oxidoreductase
MARMRDVVGWCLSLPLSVVFLAAGATKFGSPRWEMRFTAWGYPDWFRVVVGLLEVVCAILLLVPRTRRWAALVLTTLMLGAAGTHVLHGEAPRIVVNIMLAGLLVAVLALARRSDPPANPA